MERSETIIAMRQRVEKLEDCLDIHPFPKHKHVDVYVKRLLGGSKNNSH